MTTALFYYGYSDRTPLTWDIAVDRNTSKARFNIDYPYTNKPLFFGSIAGVILLAGLIVFLVVYKKKKNEGK